MLTSFGSARVVQKGTARNPARLRLDVATLEAFDDAQGAGMTSN